MLEVYLLSDGYDCEGKEWRSQVEKGTSQWHRHAERALEVSWGVMFLAEESKLRSQFDKEVVIFRALEEGMRLAS